MGLLGNAPDQKWGYGDQFNDGQGYRDQFSNRQADNFTERSSGQQPRSLLGPRPLLEDNRTTERERAIAQRERLLAEQARVLAKQAEERKLIMQREEELRLQQQQEEAQMRIQREEQMREEQLRAEQMRAVQIMQQEQQRMRPMQQQQQQRRMGKSDGLLGEAPGSVKPGIPSLLDFPGGNRLGKRPGDRVNRPGDKRPRHEVRFFGR